MTGLLKSVFEFTKTVAVAAFLAFFIIRGFIFEPYKIPSTSMEPTLKVGDFLFVSKFSYGNRLPLTDWFFWQTDPERGDIAVFKKDDPNLPGAFFGIGSPMFIKRIVAVPGDIVRYENKRLYINNEEAVLVPNGQHMYETAGGDVFNANAYKEALQNVQHDVLLQPEIPGRDVHEIVVPEDMFVLVGYYRDYRFWRPGTWGFVPRHDLMGRAEFIFWSWEKSMKPRFDRLLNSLRATSD